MTGDMNILVSSAGRRVALLGAFRAALRALGLDGQVLAIDASPMSAAFHASDGGFIVPVCNSEEFVPAVLELCELHNVRFVVPTIDPELPVYAAHRADFAAIGTTVAVSTPEVVALGRDKLLMHGWLSDNGFPTVQQGSVDDVLRDQDAWPERLIVKPRFGSASLGLRVATDRAGLEAAAASTSELIVETVAPGIEHTIDLLASKDGHCRCAVPRRRLEVRSGEVSKSVTVDKESLIDLGHRLCEALPGPYGALNVQVFEGPDGALRVIELNPRFGGGYPLTWQAGADFPRWMLEEILGRPREADEQHRWSAGLVMLRYDDAVFIRSSEVQ